MKKSLIPGLASLLFACLAMTACAADNQQKEKNDLAVYKKDAKANLTTYIESLSMNDYHDENWATIEDIANTGKKSIDAADNKTEVNAALNAAMKEIHMVVY
jgi:hypothetical protein